MENLALAEFKWGDDEPIDATGDDMVELFAMSRKMSYSNSVIITLALSASADMTQPPCIEEHIFWQGVSFCFVRTMGEK